MAKRAGKYDEIIDELPRSFGEEPSRQERINEVKASILAEAGRDFSGADLVREYGATRLAYDQQDALLYEIGLRRDALEQLMSQQFEKEGTARIVLDTNQAVSIGYEPRAKVIDPEAYRKWCIENGYENKMMLAWGTTNSIVKERLLKGDEEPDGVVAEAVLKVRYSK